MSIHTKGVKNLLKMSVKTKFVLENIWHAC